MPGNIREESYGFTETSEAAFNSRLASLYT
jgi:hypothetical protein